MTLARVLRLVAIAIAIAGIADPALTGNLQVPSALSIVLIEGAREQTVAALAAAERIRSTLVTEFATTVRVHPATSNAGACPDAGGCIVISDGRVPTRLTSGAEVIGALHVMPARNRDAAIMRVDVPPRVSLHGAAPLKVHLSTSPARSAWGVQVLDDGVLVGTSALEDARNVPATNGGTEVPPSTIGGTEVPPSASRMEGGALAPPTPSTISVNWIPLALGPRRMRVVVTAAGNDREIVDEADVGVEVTSDVSPVLMYEPEATWLGTFVRRVLAADPRLRLDARTRVAPGLTVASEPANTLTRKALDKAAAVIVSAPDSLSAAEVELLARFVRVRGGSLILLPDRRPTGPVVRLLPSITAERRETTPLTIGPLRASELLTFRGSDEGISVLESAAGQPVIVTRATGRGRIVVSGALDAWRYRDGSNQFEHFWTALVIEAIGAAGPTLDVTLDQRVIEAGDEAGVTVEWQSMDDIPPALSARAELVCNDAEVVPVRLWPAARRGVFTGVVSPMAAGTCEVRATIAQPTQRTGRAALAVVDDVRLPPGDRQTLEAAVAAHGGITVSGGEEPTLVARARESHLSRIEPRGIRPMQSPLWIVPFAGCLAVEWWLRRRRGLR